MTISYALFPIQKVDIISKANVDEGLRSVDEKSVTAIAEDMKKFGFDHSRQGQMVIAIRSCHIECFSKVSSQSVTQKIWNMDHSTRESLPEFFLFEGDDHVAEELNFVDGRHRHQSICTAFKDFPNLKATLVYFKVLIDVGPTYARAVSYKASRKSIAVNPCLVDELRCMFEAEGGEIEGMASVMKLSAPEVTIVRTMKELLCTASLTFMREWRISGIFSLSNVCKRQNRSFWKLLKSLSSYQKHFGRPNVARAYVERLQLSEDISSLQVLLLAVIVSAQSPGVIEDVVLSNVSVIEKASSLFYEHFLKMYSQFEKASSPVDRRKSMHLVWMAAVRAVMECKRRKLDGVHASSMRAKPEESDADGILQDVLRSGGCVTFASISLCAARETESEYSEMREALEEGPEVIVPQGKEISDVVKETEEATNSALLVTLPVCSPTEATAAEPLPVMSSPIQEEGPEVILQQGEDLSENERDIEQAADPSPPASLPVQADTAESSAEPLPVILPATPEEGCDVILPQGENISENEQREPLPAVDNIPSKSAVEPQVPAEPRRDERDAVAAPSRRSARIGSSRQAQGTGRNTFSKSQRKATEDVATAIGKRSRDNDYLHVEPLKKRSLRMHSPPCGDKVSRKAECANACLQRADSLLDIVSMCIVDPSGEKLLPSLPPCCDNRGSWALFTDSVESVFGRNTSAVLREIKDANYNVKDIFVISSSVLENPPNSLGNDEMLLKKQMITLRQDWNGGINDIESKGVCHFLHYGKETAENSCAVLECDRLTDSDVASSVHILKYVRIGLEHLADCGGILDCLEGRKELVEAFLGLRTTVSMFKIVDFYFDRKKSTGSYLFETLRDWIKKSCTCGGHALLHSGNEDVYNQHPLKHRVVPDVSRPFQMVIKKKDSVSDLKPFQHYSVYLNAERDISNWPCNKTFFEDGNRVEQGAFFSREDFSTAMNDSRTTIPLVKPKAFLVDAESGMRDYENRLSPFQLQRLFVAGLLEKDLWLFFDDESIASKFNQHRSCNPVVFENTLTKEHLQQFFERGFEYVTECHLVTPTLHLDELRKTKTKKQMVVCQKCQAVELFVNYGAGYTFR